MFYNIKYKQVNDDTKTKHIVSLRARDKGGI